MIRVFCIKEKAMKLNLLPCLLLALNGLAQGAPPPPFSVPPRPPGPNLPGVSRGKLETYWIAPYVRVSTAFGRPTVAWFSKDGNIQRQTEASGIEPGFISVTAQKGSGETIWGVNEDWQITLPVRVGESGYTTSTPDSRVFIEEFHPEYGLIALNIYLHGKLTTTVGPFQQYKADQVQLSDDGSASLTIWKDETRTTAQIIGLDTNGIIRFRVDCDDLVINKGVAPDGSGALLSSSSGLNEFTFVWYTSRGKLHSLEITPNPYLVGWVPKAHRSLFSTSVGYQSRHYQLIDWDKSEKLWEIPAPGTGKMLAIGITPELLLFEEAELYKPGSWRGADWAFRSDGKAWVRTFYAVSVQDGRLVARWQSKDPRRIMNGDRDRFLWINGRLFYITDNEFTELNLDDIASQRNGWTTGSAPDGR